MIEQLFDEYNIRPLVGVIPSCEDPKMMRFETDVNFWDKVRKWQEKKWVIAIHGCNHVYTSQDGGINPVQKKSEFAGVPLKIQREKISKAVRIFNEKDINATVFFSPSHTFDNYTLLALYEESSIRIISDTFANRSYHKKNFTFVPVQSGKPRSLPFSESTICLHPNDMSEDNVDELKRFIVSNINNIRCYPEKKSKRKKGFFDWILNTCYLAYRRIVNIGK
jgi:predicted deacetylase